jgi:hypothetical protein
LPYVPASTQQVENVMKALAKSHAGGRKLIDLGSGDGRIVKSFLFFFLNKNLHYSLVQGFGRRAKGLPKSWG